MILKTLNKSIKTELPMVPLRELIVFPHMIAPFFVGRSGSIKAVEEAMATEKLIFLGCQKNQKETPGEEDFWEVGTIAKILQMLKLPDGTIRVLAEGQQRATITRHLPRKQVYRVQVQPIVDKTETDPTLLAMITTLQESFKRYAKLKKKVPQETVRTILKAEYPDKLADLICANIQIKPEKKIGILRIEDPAERLEQLAVLLESENEFLNLQNRISSKVKKRMEHNQKEYFLNEQLKEINKELGRGEDDATGSKELLTRIEGKNPPAEILEKARKEGARLSKLQPMSPEAGVLRTYLEWIADLPWDQTSNDNRDINLAAKILDEDHFGMKKPKERILDFIAVRQLKERLKGPILCLLGPPGTGKTSLGRSVARALGREFLRISLGGVRDEAEIRGHRKTYVGALPGKILQSMKKAATTNPVFLLDEIDKISSDFRGDPASALLEVLDPEQNSTFMDHYLEVPYDLSGVMFITTANSVHSIPRPLLDRMEIIEIPGYTDFEKARIASDFIIPKQVIENGLSRAKITFQKGAILEIIHRYTMESGVRNLEREIAAVIRKIARKAVKEGFTGDLSPGGETPFRAQITTKGIYKYLGNPKFQEDLVYKESCPGLVHGLAWTELGGTLLPVEITILEGNGELILTGSLGDVMKESARIALSFILSKHSLFGLKADFQKTIDIHIHVPEGAIPKDGPSAGITMTSAMISALTEIPVRSRWAMTGEVTLTGRILPIGGVKEKILAAHRNKMDLVLMPEGNRKDLVDLPKEARDSIKFVFVDTVLEAMGTLFPDLEMKNRKKRKEDPKPG